MKVLDFNSFINQDRQKTKPVNEHLWSGIIKRSETGDVRKEDIVRCQNTEDIQKEVQNIIDRIHPKEGDTIDLNMIDVSNVDNMLGLFQDDLFTKYNYNVSKWDVSNAKNMGHMFSSCKNFNCDLSKWNVSKVESMDGMFYDCKKLNCDLSQWELTLKPETINFPIFCECDSLDDENFPKGFGKLDYVWTYHMDFNEFVKTWIILDFFKDYKKLDHSDASSQTDTILELFKDWCDIKYVDVYAPYYKNENPKRPYRCKEHKYCKLINDKDSVNYDEKTVKKCIQ
jgi:surface protein